MQPFLVYRKFENWEPNLRKSRNKKDSVRRKAQWNSKTLWWKHQSALTWRNLLSSVSERLSFHRFSPTFQESPKFSTSSWLKETLGCIGGQAPPPYFGKCFDSLLGPLQLANRSPSGWKRWVLVLPGADKLLFKVFFDSLVIFPAFLTPKNANLAGFLQLLFDTFEPKKSKFRKNSSSKMSNVWEAANSSIFLRKNFCVLPTGRQDPLKTIWNSC